MNRYKETFNTWNKIASLYEKTFMDLDLYNDTYNVFCTFLEQENPNILEIGCGPGNITKYILSKRADFNILGIDIASNMIKLAKKNNPTANFKVMDSRDINSLKTKFDAVICGFCLPYLSESDCIKLIKDCTNLLSKKGILYISFVEGLNSKSGYITDSSGDKMFFYYHNLSHLKNNLAKNNFKIVNLITKNYTKKNGSNEVHTIIIAAKSPILQLEHQ